MGSSVGSGEGRGVGRCVGTGVGVSDGRALGANTGSAVGFGRHCEEPSDDTVLAEHLMHKLAPDVGEKEFAGQYSQWIDPDTDENMPASHAVHEVPVKSSDPWN